MARFRQQDTQALTLQPTARMNQFPHSIEFISETVLRGPNGWTYCPVLETQVDIGSLEDFPSNLIPGFSERLSAWLPGLIEHRCSPGVRGGFLQRLGEGTWPAHILEHVSLELLGLVGLQSGFGRARETEKRGVYRVIISAQQEAVSRLALQIARDLVLAAMADRPFDLEESVELLRDLAESKWLGPSTAAIAIAAEERGIPMMRLNEGNLVQFGYGCQQRRIWTAETDRTSAIAEGVSRDKELTRRLLAQCGVPVPEGRIVATPEEAWEAAQEIGLPVVIKPTDGNHGRGVFTHLSSQEEIIAAWKIAVQEGSAVLVERFIVGNEHRILVVGGTVVAAARGQIASVIGDGESTVLDLIESQLNSDPRRGTTEDHPLNRVRIDSAAQIELSRQGLTEDAIPAVGQEVLIQRNGNVAFDVTDQVHPEVAEQVCLAARIVGLDIAGIDLVAQDISRPLADQGAAIVEVNAGPGLLMHLKPADGVAQPVGKAIIDHLFSAESTGRIPLVGVTGGCGRLAVAQGVAQLLREDGRRTGLACANGVWIDQRRLQAEDGANWNGARRLLLNPRVEAAVIENDSHIILNEGLAYDRCQIGIVIDAAEAAREHPELADTAANLRVLRTQVDVVLPSGCAILDATDPVAVKMIELCDGEVLLFSIDAASPVLLEHLKRSGRAVTVRDDFIVLVYGNDEVVLGPVSDFAETAQNLNALNCVLAIAAAGWALGIAPAQLRGALKTRVTQEFLV
jgi:cyanophycin synthetase